MPKLVNWDLLKEPANWVIVVLMLLIGVFGLKLITASASA